MKYSRLAATLLVTVGMLALSIPSQADVRIGIGIGSADRYRRGHADTFRLGYDRGLEEGHREGAKEGRGNDRFSFWDEKRYRNGDSGYKGWMGPRGEYANGYRRGYEEGYRRSYRRSDRNDRDRYGRDGYRDDRNGSERNRYERDRRR